ncbi:MAG: hypothetical protein GY838_01830 [bacterium]|nr:hypothetical protein [bacterium]
MPFVEQLLYGSDSGQPKDRRVLAHSPGIAQAVAGEIRQICEGWGPVPMNGLEHQSMMSVPLRNTIASMRGRLYAVVQVGRGPSPIHHVVVLTESDYGIYGHNPYALRGSFEFLEQWRVGIILDRQQIGEATDEVVISPPPSPQDLVVVTESLRQILVKGRLQLPLAQPTADSERSLALIIAGLPAPLRREMRFASFATSEANGYTLFAMGTPNCAFNGWQRLLMSEVAAIVPEDVEAYVKSVGARVGVGDLPGVCRESRRCTVVPGLRKPDPARERAMPQPAVPRRPPERTASAVPAQPRQPAQATTSSVPSVRKQRSRPRKPARTSRLVKAGRELRVRGGGRPRRRRILPVVAVAVLVAVVLWWQMPAIEDKLIGRIGWFADGESSAEVDHATTLLQVIDVGEAYDREIKRLAQAGFMGRDDPDRSRRRALVDLQTDMAGPLLDQTDLFTALAAEGIQQPDRPRRELARLGALDVQGAAIADELKRLELAWHSLATGTDWRDLSSLDDRALDARRDSLRRANKAALASAALELGTSKASQRVSVARRQVAGMVELLELFQATTWSERWEERLAAAADKVSPRTSTATRAYRNAAFAFLRLKGAERSRAARECVYTAEFRDGAWPSPEVADILPDLHTETARFGRGKAPSILVGILKLYDSLGESSDLVSAAVDGAVLDRLAENPAVRFDPERYAGYLSRIRYEAAARVLEAGPDSVALPGHLYSADDAEAVRRFHAASAAGADSDVWWGQVETQTLPFFARWAEQRAGAALADEVRSQGIFDTAWTECVSRAAAVRERAVAGNDWTAVWLDLHEQVGKALGTHAARAEGDVVRADRVELLSDLKQYLESPRGLGVTGATVRMPQEILEASTTLVLELVVAGGAVTLRSAPFTVGPAAPAGSGWVGTVPLDWLPAVGAADALAARVLTPEGTEVFAVDYPSLLDRVGPGAMARPRGDDGHTLSFQLAAGWWRGLAVPVLDRPAG